MINQFFCDLATGIESEEIIISEAELLGVKFTGDIFYIGKELRNNECSHRICLKK